MGLAQRRRRVTPADRPAVLEEWRALEEEYVNHGYSRHQSHLAIAERYATTAETARRWLRYGVGSTETQKKVRPYAERVKNPNHLKKSRFARRLSHSPARYIVPLVKEPTETLSLEELSLRLQDAHNYLPRLRTLERLLVKPHPRTGDVVLVQVRSEPPLYRLNERLVGRQ